MSDVLDDTLRAKALLDTFNRNQAYMKPGATSFQTQLSPSGEQGFRNWVTQNKVPFDPGQQTQDYDMRGFYSALQAHDPRAETAINPNDAQIHYPDYWKTPYHQSFSAESQWADPTKAPKWNEQDQLVLPDGTVVFDEKRNAK